MDVDTRGENRRERGFTVSEILTVVGIIALIVLVTLPALGERYRGYRVRAAANDLVADLRVARHTAIAKRQEVDVTVRDESDTPPNEYTYTRSDGEVRTVTMPDLVQITSAPTGPFVFKQDGGLDGAAGTVTLQSRVSDQRIDQYSVTVATAGTITVEYDAVAP
ncbi:MAG: GspH/FimT family pseudopilin [Acidobacteria bacterium]|nr:GspH/FimT family pseudopilin [Acidobacteriota bacterium]